MSRKILLILFVISMVVSAQKNPEITAEELKAHVKYLASDELKGRKPATPGSKLASEYLVKHLQEYGYKFFNENPYHNFEITTGVNLGETNNFGANGITFEVEKDYTPTTLSSNGEAKGKGIFVGYGFDIDDEKLKWNDYEDAETEGSIVFVLRGAPENDSLTNIFDENSALTKKVLTAKDNGASAIVFVSGKKFDEGDMLMKLSSRSGINGIGIPVVHLKRDKFDEILAAADLTTFEMENFYEQGLKPNSFEIGDVSLNVEVVEEKADARNVVAYLEGSDPELKNQYVLFGGHYDHLGMGGSGSGSRRPDTTAIHNGADDNASGTAAVLELAEKFAANRNKIKRTLIYTAFDAEEMGLLGSKAFVEKPPVELESLKFMANLDMIGRLDSTERNLTIGGTGTGIELHDILNGKAEKWNITPSFSPEGLGPSDHASFYANDIPVMFLFSGINDDYHTPADDYEKLNYGALEDIANFAYDVVFEIANSDSNITFQEAGPKERTDTRRSFKVTLGIMPDFSGGSVKGLKIDAVMPDRPAQKSGMLRGDIIVSMDGKEVENIYDYMHRLGDLKKGQIIEVQVKRGEEIVKLEVEL
ncbi:MAG: hypothetical protein SCALA702_22280 [Melioribacteraceae bacterium]|nr:MAG: hypothetical protein SCALA702_22280 [Melioribacteraceae bacterium]